MTPSEHAEVWIIIIKRLLKWVSWLIGIAILIGTAFFAYFEFSKWHSQKPRLVTTLYGITIGEKFTDFLFKNPGFTEKNKKESDSPDVRYFDNNSGLFVDIREGKVFAVRYLCAERDDFTSIHEIECQSLGEAILNKYPNDIRILCRKDKSVDGHLNYRVYDAVQYGVRHLLQSNKVVGFFISEPKTLDGLVGINWTQCQ